MPLTSLSQSATASPSQRANQAGRPGASTDVSELGRPDQPQPTATDRAGDGDSRFEDGVPTPTVASWSGMRPQRLGSRATSVLAGQPRRGLAEASPGAGEPAFVHASGWTMDNAMPFLRDGLSEVVGHMRVLSAYTIDPAPARTSSRRAKDFIEQARSRHGATYRWGGKPRTDDKNPQRMDCSGLVKWAAGRVGISLPEGSMQQLGRVRSMSVEKALRTPGALLFRKDPGRHVAISLGNGRVLESSYPVGVREASASGRGFTHGGWIPGMRQ